MKLLFTLYAIIIISIGIFCINVKAQNHKRAAENPHKCQQFQRHSDALKADNENLKIRLAKMEKTLQKQLQQESDAVKELDNFQMKLQALETLLVQQKSVHLRVLKDTIAPLRYKKCNYENTLLQEYQKFSKLQNSITKKINVQYPKIKEMDEDVNQLLESELEPDNEHFCSNFYVKTLTDLSGNITILQNIDDKLKTVNEKNIAESERHKQSIDALPELIANLEKKDKSEICVRTQDKSTICSHQPHPTSCAQYDPTHCSGDKCLIKNFIYGSEPFEVSCDHITDGGGWIVIQRRINGSEDFYRNWTEYKTGFGNLNGEFWLGLDKLHALTKTLAPVELLIQLKDHKDVMKYAKFSEFSISNETELYELKEADGYKGNAGDSFSYHKGQKFTTKDMDNDESYSYNCAVEMTGAWWYEDCHWSNLNGMYYQKGVVSKSMDGQGICWHDFHGYKYSLKFTQMMIRTTTDTLSDIELM